MALFRELMILPSIITGLSSPVIILYECSLWISVTASCVCEHQILSWGCATVRQTCKRCTTAYICMRTNFPPVTLGKRQISLPYSATSPVFIPLPSWDNEHIESNLFPQPVNKRQAALFLHQCAHACTHYAHTHTEIKNKCVCAQAYPYLCNQVQMCTRRLRHAFAMWVTRSYVGLQVVSKSPLLSRSSLHAPSGAPSAHLPPPPPLPPCPSILIAQQVALSTPYAGRTRNWASNHVPTYHPRWQMKHFPLICSSRKPDEVTEAVLNFLSEVLLGWLQVRHGGDGEQQRGRGGRKHTEWRLCLMTNSARSPVACVFASGLREWKLLGGSQ